jgi:hypothetical protein
VIGFYGDAPAHGLRATLLSLLKHADHLRKGGSVMEPRRGSRNRLSLEALDNRIVPTVVTTIPLGQQGSAQPGIFQLATNPSNGLPFHLEEAGQGVLDLANGKITASASGIASQLGKFTLTDSSDIVGIEPTANGLVIQVDGDADLVAANGDILKASFTGSVNMTLGVGDLTFEWVAGGSGRFENPSGTTQWHLNVNPETLAYTAVADGVINF